MAKLYGDLTGKKFGKLTVIERAEDIVSASGKSKSMAWKCKCDCGNEIIIRDSTLKKETHLIKSCGCSKEINPNYKSKNMKAEDIVEWSELYDYVNNNVMGYDKNCLSNNMILRLKGMREGKFLQNKKAKSRAEYPYSVILITFKFCLPEINRALRTKSFYTEELKFNYICAIVESNLSTVYLKLQNNKKAKEQIETMDISVATYEGAEYKPKEKTEDKFADLW